MNNYNYLQTKRKIYYSQHGEDGLLEYILSKLPTNKWVVEFGAWDAKHLSNTYHFIEKLNYSAVLIEGEPSRMIDLEKNTEAFKERVHPINAFVGFEGENTLDNLLKKTPIPVDFDVLSIDIDGKDYHVWEAFNNYKPKVVIIEINSRKKPHEDQIHAKDDDTWVSFVSGTSLKSVTELANKKGYALIANVLCNALFIDKKYLNLFFDKEPTPEQVFTYEAYDLSELNLAEAKQKGRKHYIKKLMRYPYHLIKYGK